MGITSDVTVLEELFNTLKSRKSADPSSSYTAKLLNSGRGKIAKKLGEEAIEAVIAATSESKEQQIYESADVIYHLMVMWLDCGIEPQEVYGELARRFGTSGIAEKNTRNGGND